ncbi:hypothetical protein PVAP13_6NG069850 [Panicum virgatum]|uniref:Uncharacterized protein n=1 Tax=Panicum virgatum TaxID=38727 RepID=A0A8T0QV06_PANVG|nr:hypothetical protein PVAP13_6NG069850 [Panicum virgatum]
MVDKSQWHVVDPGFEMLPPKLERAAGRPRVKRIKARGEPGKRRQYQCKRCLQFGHIEKGCFEPPTELGVELPPSFAAKSKKRKGEAGTSKQPATKKSKKGGAKKVEPRRVQQQAHLLSPLLNLMLNYHLHFLPNLSQGKERLLHQHLRSLPKSPKKMAHQAP